MYFDMDGKPITREEWSRSFSGDRHIGKDVLPSGHMISTVWLGLDHGPGGRNAKPLIFESMVFPPDSWRELEMRLYSTKEQARRGHAALVKKWSRKKLVKSLGAVKRKSSTRKKRVDRNVSKV